METGARRLEKTRQAIVLNMVADELSRALIIHGSMTSPHEGYAVILEELDELWTETMANRGHSERAMKEAIQIAAMGLRYVMDLGTFPELENL